MIFKNFDQLLEAVKNTARKTVVLAAAHDDHALEAVLEANKKGMVDYLAVGQRDKIKEIAKSHGFEVADDCIVDADAPEECAKVAIQMIREEKGDFLMKGKLETAVLLRAALDKETGIRTGSTMSHVAILELPGYHKLLGFTDGGMIPYPTLEQKKMITKNAVDLFHGLGYEEPKVAIMAASETPNPRQPETEDAVELVKMCEAGDFGKAYVGGPISFDLAWSKESAEIKGYKSPLVADSDIMVVPNIACGNLTSKCMIYVGGAKMAGVIMGAKVPIVLTSRGASAEEKYLSLMLASASRG